MAESLSKSTYPRPVPEEGYTAAWWDTHERRALEVARLSLTGADWLVEHIEIPLPVVPNI